METLETPKPKDLVGSREGVRIVSADFSNTNMASVISSAPLPPSAPTTEHCSLINFAYRLGAIVKNNDPSIVDQNGVRQEAKLLMSLSSSSTMGNNFSSTSAVEAASPVAVNAQQHVSGRITPQSVTSASSGGSRRETFCFTCPALSLEDKDNTDEDNNNASSRENEDREVNTVDYTTQEGLMNCPAVMMGRTLKVDDKDAMRLSSDAMARNVMQSFQKAMKWRIQSWVDSLSAVLVQREQELLEQGEGNDEALLDALYYSNEALLVAALRQIESKIQVLETSTEFKVLHKVTNAAVDRSKKQRLDTDEDDRAGLEEGEYVYDVLHVLELQCALTISSPAGNVQIDLNVPGTIKGTFLSSEENYHEELTDVNIHVNTAMLATMIERSSRIAVRCSAEAMLKGECVETSEKEGTKTSPSIESAAVQTPSTLPAPKTLFESPHPAASTRSPKRKLSEDDVHPVSGLVVITPARDASSPSDFADSDSDGDTKPSKLQIPDNFHRSKPSGSILFPSAIRSSNGAGAEAGSRNLSFAGRLPPKKTYGTPMVSTASAAGVVTPMKTSPPEYECREKGPVVPLLELASAAALDSVN